MIVVDSSVWIDYFNGRKKEQTDLLHSLLGRMPIIMGDLILAEVLQGFQKDRDFRITRNLLFRFPFMTMGEEARALESASNYRLLRRRGLRVRKTIDVMIGTFCIHHRLPLLHDEQDFDPMVKYLGLEIIKP